MAKEIWLGPLLSSNRSRLLARCAELVSQGQANSFLYLAASQPLLQLTTNSLLDGRQNRGLWGELPVYLFRGFVRRILTTAVDVETNSRPGPRIPIDREELPLKRSLVSQLLKRLTAAGELKALGPLSHRDGCVNTVSTLMGEIQRAARTPEEFRQIVAALIEESPEPTSEAGPRLQRDFDRDIALVYAHYFDILEQHQLTEADADQLRALGTLRGRWQGKELTVPWLADVRLLVLDGFFDFTPVQGEIIRELIPRIPGVIVNLNSDERNTEIFSVFRETIDQIAAAGEFEIRYTGEMESAAGALSVLRERLFNSSKKPNLTFDNGNLEREAQNIRLLSCSDRETEIRAIAKEIKRLIFQEDYKLADIALVVRERASYAETIARVMRAESIPCDLEQRIDIKDIPAVRAARKVFELLKQLTISEPASIRITELANLIKSDYLRPGDDQLAEITEQFHRDYSELLNISESNGDSDPAGEARRKRDLGIGTWSPDILENVIAFVGGELRVTDWLTRARRLLQSWPQLNATEELVAAPETEQSEERQGDDETDGPEKATVQDKDIERKRRPARDVHPAAIAWAALVIEQFSNLIKRVPRQGSPAELRLGLLRLLDQLQLDRQIRRPISRLIDERELPQVMLDLRGLEALRRAFVAAIKSIEIAEATLPVNDGAARLRLSTFLDEVTRSLGSQIQIAHGADPGGLRVLEATDVRGLRFRAIFIAGLVEGGFPLRLSRDWIYPHDERERLKRYGLTLEDISPATLLKEEHYFYQAACRAMDRLYLTRPVRLEDGTETVASYYIDELRHAVAPLNIETEVVRRDFDGKALLSSSTPSELARGLVRQEERQRHRTSRLTLLSPGELDGLLLWARETGVISSSAQRRIKIERTRAGRWFSSYDGQITDPDLQQLVAAQFGPEYTHSASGLGLYGNCPYKFFARRLLRLEPRGEAALDLQALDAGKLLHDVLRRFLERHRRERLDAKRLEALRLELAEVADQVFDEHERTVPPLNPSIWKLDREIRKVILDQVLLFEMGVQEKAAAADVKPAYFEVAFGMRAGQQPADPLSRSEPLTLTRGDAENIKIQGQVDRVDMAADGTLIAYDYKLSSGASTDDVKTGRNLQLPIYLEALEKLLLPGHSIAGGGFYVLRGGSDRRNRGMYRKEFEEYTKLRAQNSVFSDYEWQQLRAEAIARIWEFLDGMRAGRFVVNPAEGYKTCRFCDYAAVCRYDKYRIQGKKVT